MLRVKFTSDYEFKVVYLPEEGYYNDDHVDRTHDLIVSALEKALGEQAKATRETTWDKGPIKRFA